MNSLLCRGFFFTAISDYLLKWWLNIWHWPKGGSRFLNYLGHLGNHEKSSTTRWVNKNWSNSCGKHPGKLRWQWKYIHLTMYLLVKMVIFHLAMFVFRRQGFFLNSANINWQLRKSNCKYHYFTMMLKFPERFAMLPRFLPLTLSVWYCWWTIHPAKNDKITKKHRNTEYPKWFAT